MNRQAIFALIAFLAAPGWALAADSSPPDYAARVAPLLTRYCAGCHNADDREGKLVLEDYAGMMAGGEHGPAIVAGDSQASRLIQSLTGKGKPAMPPEDEAKPTAEEVAVLAAWIDAGAKGPTGPVAEGAALNVPRIVPRMATPEPLTALAVSPNGQLLAVAHYSRLELIGAADRAVKQTLTGVHGRITWLGFDATGATLLAAAGEPGSFGEARQWNVADGSPIRSLIGHRDSLNAAALSPDGALLATASYDQTVKLWNLADGAEVHTFAGHSDAVYDLAFRPDGRVLASVSGDRTVKLWDVAERSRLDTLSQSLKELYATAMSPGGAHLAAAGVDGRIRVWRLTPQAKENTNQMVHNVAAHDAPVVRLAWSPDGSLLASASEDRTIKLWEAPALRERATLELQSAAPLALAISPDNSRLFVGRLDGSLGDYSLAGLASAEEDVAPLDDAEATVDYGPQPPVDRLPKAPESEPNDSPEMANPLPAPGVASGVIQRGAENRGDVDLFRFEARRGERWILETKAARNGSKLDSRIEILHADGLPVERLLLRAVRDSELEFRSEDSSDRGMRLANWDEMSLNDLVYLEGEVVKLYQQRRGPDADGLFYPEGGQRFTFFDTNPRSHPLGAKCYFVEPHRPGTKLAYNGLPVFTLDYENDDDGQRKLGSDSRLTFTAPADGAYLARVSDVRGFAGDDYRYELILRRPQPGFTARIDGAADKAGATTVPAGGGKRIKVFVDRQDGFAGEVRVSLSGLPPGFYATPLVVEAGHRDAHGVLFAHPLATAPTDANAGATVVAATATIAGRETSSPVAGLGKLALGPKPKILVRLATPGEGARMPSGDAASPEFPQPAELALVAGSTATCQLSVERNGFAGIINFEADNLPHGVIVDNIGLNGIQLLEGQTERTLSLSAEGWVAEQLRPFQLVAKEDGAQVSLPLVLRIVKQ